MAFAKEVTRTLAMVSYKPAPLPGGEEDVTTNPVRRTHLVITAAGFRNARR